MVEEAKGYASRLLNTTNLLKEIKMPKLKTKSSVKKRFKTSSTGKLVVGNVGKRHGMSKRTNSFIRSSKGTRVLSKSASIIVESMMPYGK